MHIFPRGLFGARSEKTDWLKARPSPPMQRARCISVQWSEHWLEGRGLHHMASILQLAITAGFSLSDWNGLCKWIRMRRSCRLIAGQTKFLSAGITAAFIVCQRDGLLCFRHGSSAESAYSDIRLECLSWFMGPYVVWHLKIVERQWHEAFTVEMAVRDESNVWETKLECVLAALCSPFPILLHNILWIITFSVSERFITNVFACDCSVVPCKLLTSTPKWLFWHTVPLLDFRCGSLSQNFGEVNYD